MGRAPPARWRRADLLSALDPWLGRWRPLPGDNGRVVVGCSGGPDSLALLALASAHGLDAVAVHVDHGLRSASARDIDAVWEAARRLGSDVVAHRVDIDPGPNLEARAREMRLQALDAARRELRAGATLLGHTRDDQAETVLLNLLRGSATTGMAGIPPVRGTIVHPILDLGRDDTAEICARLGLDPVRDPMNDDRSFRRVWLRREVIPLLEAGAERDLRSLLGRQASIVRDEVDLLDDLAGVELHALGSEPGAQTLAATVAGLPPGLGRRVVRRWLGDRPHPPAFDEVEQVLAVARGERRAVELTAGLRIERARGLLARVERVSPPTTRSRGTVPGVVEAGGWRVATRVENAPPAGWPDGAGTCVLDADIVGPRVELRPSRPGERFRPLGMSGSKPISSVLADAGVPMSERRGHPILTDATGIALWVVGYRVGAPARVTACTRRFLWAEATVGGEAVSTS